MVQRIDEFRGQYFCFSNFFERRVIYNSIAYDNNEAAFQAQKESTHEAKLKYMHLPPSNAKAKGRKARLKSKKVWDESKDQIMYEICMCKFTQNKDLQAKLLSTGDAILIEGNTWRDKYWGVYRGVGQNKLGKILMRIREELRRYELLDVR